MNARVVHLCRSAVAVAALLPFGLALAAPPPPPAIDWSGFYAGVHAGYGGGMSDWDDSGTFFDFAGRGALVGGQLGFNKQIASFVFGVELDGSWANISGSQSPLIDFTAVGGPLRVFKVNTKVDGLLTLSGRAGLAADRWFVFAKGGVAGAWERHLLNTADNVGDSAVGNSNMYRWGPTVGFGAEYALNGNWSLKAEYDYIHFAGHTVTLNGFTTSGGVTTPFTGNVDVTQNSIHLVKVGANYRLGGRPINPSYPPVVPAPGTNWTGVYIGAQGGYGVGHMEWPDLQDPNTPGMGTYNPRGWLGGINGGVNVQSGVLVFGIEGEWMKTGLSGGRTDVLTIVGGTEVFSQQTDIDWLAIASARVGFAATDRLLVYGKGGIAIASEKHSLSADISAPPTSQWWDLNMNAVHSGVALGIGAEYALAGNWSIKGEYDYIHMTAQNVAGNVVRNHNSPGLVGTWTVPLGFSSVSQNLNLFKLGANYRINP